MPAATVALPVWKETAETLIREIAAGRRLPGERLPPERDLASAYGISVGTLRKALADLEGRGLLDRRQGSGNYVTGAAEATGVYAFFRLELAEGGGLPTAEVLSVAPEPGALRVRRLRRVGGRPAAIEAIRVEHAEAPRLAARDLSDSLYLTWREALGLVVARVEDRVGIGTVPDWAPSAFGLAPGAVSGEVLRVGRDAGGRVVERSTTWFDQTVVRYVARHR